MELSKEQIEKILEENKASLLDGIAAELKAKITHTIRYDDAVSGFVTKWISENVIPEVESALVESKYGMISTAIKFAETVPAILADSMSKEIKKKMENSWERKKVFDALLS